MADAGVGIDEPLFSPTSVPTTSRPSSSLDTAAHTFKRKRGASAAAAGPTPERLQAITGLLNSAATTLKDAVAEEPLKHGSFARYVVQ